MAFSTGRDNSDVVSEINITPLVDVMLVLLVVFMVTAPLLTAGLRVELPNVAAEEAPACSSVTFLSIQARAASRASPRLPGFE